jgi:hypothetical protein
LSLFALIPLSQTATAKVQGLASVRIEQVPHVHQKPDFCGEACVEMVLAKLGKAGDQDFVFDQSGLDPALGRGCYTPELRKAVERIGFEPGPVWHAIQAARATSELDAQFQALHQDLRTGVASIVCTHYDETPGASEHFRLVVGYDAETDELIYHEPAEAAGAYQRMQRSRFLRLWPLKTSPETWTLIRLRMQPGQTLASASPGTGRSPADYAQHVLALKRRYDLTGFTILVEPPFVVLGDEPAAQVRKRAAGTVRWATEKLKAAYFSRNPEAIISIWLFADEHSYETHCKEFFRNEPGTPFGYFSEEHDALIMNIATGGGTLVHEMVHPFVKANFPDCPAWFNEGLGSLCEQCGERDAGIVGYTNWRLAGLQKAIRAQKLPSIERLVRSSTRQFYYEDPGTNYAQARYLLFYLQEQGKLGAYYRAFHAARESDPTGLATLKQVLGRDDLAAFQKNWEAWVLTLRFP